jgi:tRNA pseudouridine55 synthase
MNGIFIIDKPGGMTSHDVVNHVRKFVPGEKVGHLGTLDPMATGVLPVCTGKATRFGQFLDLTPKEYIGDIQFGFSTTTYDREGSPTSAVLPMTVSREEVESAIRTLTGRIDQVPPPFSAKKIGGVPSYKLARRGRSIENPAVSVEVYEFAIVGFEPPRLSFRVACSAGTYVRSLAHDLGQSLECGAHLTSLRRIRCGEFAVEAAVTLEQLSPERGVPMEKLLSSLPLIEVSGIEEHRVVHGNDIPAVTDGRLARIFNKRGEFLAVAAVENGWARPRLVLTSIS